MNPLPARAAHRTRTCATSTRSRTAHGHTPEHLDGCRSPPRASRSHALRSHARPTPRAVRARMRIAARSTHGYNGLTACSVRSPCTPVRSSAKFWTTRVLHKLRVRPSCTWSISMRCVDPCMTRPLLHPPSLRESCPSANPAHAPNLVPAESSLF